MSASPSDTQGLPNGKVPFQFDAEGEEQFELLKASLTLGEGFQLFFIGCSSVYGWDEIQKRLDQYSQEIKTEFIILHYKKPGELDQLFEDLISLPETESESWVIVRTEGMDDERKAGWNTALSILNERRNKLMKECPRSILLIDTPWLIQFAPGRSPDLWSVRTSAVVLASQINVDKQEQLFLRHPNTIPYDHELHEGEYYYNLAKSFEKSSIFEEQVCRSNLIRKAAVSWANEGNIAKAIKSLNEVVTINLDINNDVGVASAKSQIADIYYNQGDYDKVLSIQKEEVLPIYEKKGLKRATAVAKGKIADVYDQRGQYEKVLDIRENEELGVYREIGDKREEAVVLTKISNLYFKLDDYDRSLYIRREIALPIFEALGDVFNVAVVKGLIADILTVTGHTQDALRLLHDEVLPIYEKLGNVRALILAKGQIADLYFQQGKHDEALFIRERIQLPAYEKLNDLRETAIVKGKIASYLFAMGMVDKALDYLQGAESIFEKLNIPRELSIVRDMRKRFTTENNL